MMSSSLRRAAVVAAVASAASFGVLPSADAATSAQPEQVCQIGSVNYPGIVTSTPIARPQTSDILYFLQTGQWFRVVAYSGDYYYGHGDGKANGYMDRNYIDQSTCHYT